MIIKFIDHHHPLPVIIPMTAPIHRNPMTTNEIVIKAIGIYPPTLSIVFTLTKLVQNTVEKIPAPMIEGLWVSIARAIVPAIPTNVVVPVGLKIKSKKLFMVIPEKPSNVSLASSRFTSTPESRVPNTPNADTKPTTIEKIVITSTI